MNLDQCRALLKKRLSAGLYRHTLGVAETAAKLALAYGADREKAYLAGLVHDYAKELEPALLRQKAEDLQLSLDPVTLSEGHKLLHAPVGAALAREELGIVDPEISSAIFYHTTGRAGMSVLEKVVYLADFIEPNREFAAVGRLRELSRRSLDRAVLAAVDLTITLVLQRGLMLHPDSVALRNDLIALIRKQGNGG